MSGGLPDEDTRSGCGPAGWGRPLPPAEGGIESSPHHFFENQVER